MSPVPSVFKLFSGRNNGVGFLRLMLASAVIVSHSRDLGFGLGDVGGKLSGGQVALGGLAVFGFFVGWGDRFRYAYRRAGQAGAELMLHLSTYHGPGTQEQFLEYLKDSFDVFYDEAKKHPKMMSVGLRCRMIGRPGRIGSLDKFVSYAKEFPGVWFATRGEIAQWWLDNHPDGGQGDSGAVGRAAAHRRRRRELGDHLALRHNRRHCRGMHGLLPGSRLVRSARRCCTSPRS